MIYTVTLNPALDRELSVEEITFNSVLRATDWRVDCGGKGFNVARMLQALGTASTALGFAGGKSGEFLRDSLQQLGIASDFVWIDGESRTNVSIVAGERHIKVNEPGPTVTDGDVRALLAKIKALVAPGQWWILAGSLPPGAASSIYGEMTAIIEAGGAKVFLDTSGDAFVESCSAGPTIVKPNDVEAAQLTGLPVETQEQRIAAGHAIREMGAENVIISLGKAGAMLVTAEGAWMAESPEIVEQNPTGAGDSMVGGVIWGIDQGLSLAEALRCGIACGAATASRKGTEIGTKAQVEELMARVEVVRL